MSEIFEVKRTKLFYKYNSHIFDNISNILSFRGVITSLEHENHTVKEDIIIGFYDFKEDCYYWFYKDFDEFYLNKLEGINCCNESLNAFEAAMNENVHCGTFRLTHVAHDYSLFIKREDR